MKRLLALYPLYFLLLAACSSTQHIQQQPEFVAQQLGTVSFPVSCSEKSAVQVARGLALMHHMTYEDARQAFVVATEIDSHCAMGYWGEAMTYIHPLWSDPPTKEMFEKGKLLTKKAKSQRHINEWEQAYVNALESYFSGEWQENEAPLLERFAAAWKQVHEAYPDDTEAASLYALANLSTADPSDKTYGKQKQSGAIANQVLQDLPDHPGGHHYLIHAYDYPSLAKDALSVARSYGSIAPDIPHSLHMPTHIFTREGLWKESIENNLKSAEAAWRNPVDGTVSLHYLHALDYLVYAYLQGGEDASAHQILRRIQGIDRPIQVHIVSAYALSAIPVRIVLERHQWVKAAELKPRQPASFAWNKFPAMESMTYFARALGAAHTNQFEQAQADINKLAELKAALPDSAHYWAIQIEIQRLSAIAWLHYQQNDKRAAYITMASAVDLEASTEKHPVTPGEVLSAHELFADMLLSLGHIKDALVQYEASLKRNPNRFNSLFGAGYVNELILNKGQATYYYKALIELTANADTNSEELAHARKFLNL